MKEISNHKIDYYFSHTNRKWCNINNEIHRYGRPAMISHLRTDSSKVFDELWLINGKPYDNKPTHIIYERKNVISEKRWYNVYSDKIGISKWVHRDYGPVKIRYMKKRVAEREWRINGNVVTLQIEKWLKDNKIKLNNKSSIPNKYRAEFRLRFY